MFDALPENAEVIGVVDKQQLANAFLEALPSTKIRMAIKDLEAVERSAKYEVDMDTWHTAARHDTDGRCRVCLAGSVMANRHDIMPSQTYVGPFEADGPDEYSAPDEWDSLFGALDELRSGYVTEFLSIEGTMPDNVIEKFAAQHGPEDPYEIFPGHVAYEDDGAGFKRWAIDIAQKLETAGY